MLLNIALCDCSVNTDNHSLYLLLLFLKLKKKKNITVSKTKFIFFLPKIYIMSKFVSVVVLDLVIVVIYKSLKLDTQHTHPIPRNVLV